MPVPIALCISEIVEIILQGLDNGSLVNVARCCRTLSDAALDFLWDSVDVGAFTFSMPLDFQYVSRMQYWRSEDASPCSKIRLLSKIKNIPEDEWRRFDYYASRVRSLDMGTCCAVQLFYYMAALRPGIHIFPALHTLKIRAESGPVPTRQFPPTLRHLTVVVNGVTYRNWWEYSLYNAVAQSPHLKSLSIECINQAMIPLPMRPTAEELDPLDFPRLQSLDLTGATQRFPNSPFLTALSHLPISTLRLPSLDHVPLHPRFANLQYLSICSWPLQIGRFLSALDTSVSLRVLAIDNRCDPDKWPYFRSNIPNLADYSRCFNYIARRFGHSLRRFAIILDGYFETDQEFEEGRALVRLVSPLYKLARLEVLVLALQCRTDLCKEAEDILSPQAWPTLERFEFHPLIRHARGDDIREEVWMNLIDGG
ncbi:hypothetical protein BV22DRAFT_1047261 [Leucogyrophana mollusca]|uniref:Uncharacterized protein n=1 Tax=Leucogyrophana mollusca TaxID=85980 RepID=A0ACB8BFZ5_9AGAM|nr:hypothetical protein BV22DRAFT_1047261 [Leucogyrophana mollusca]